VLEWLHCGSSALACGRNAPKPSMVRDANAETRRRREMRQRQLAEARAAAAGGVVAATTANPAAAAVNPAAALVGNFFNDLQATHLASDFVVKIWGSGCREFVQLHAPSKPLVARRPLWGSARTQCGAKTAGRRHQQQPPVRPTSSFCTALLACKSVPCGSASLHSELRVDDAYGSMGCRSWGSRRSWRRWTVPMWTTTASGAARGSLNTRLPGSETCARGCGHT
jgi:hypothetical protein